MIPATRLFVLLFLVQLVSGNRAGLADDFKVATTFPTKLHKQIKTRSAPKGDLHGNIDSNRTLKSKDVSAILVFSDILMDKKRKIGEREHAAECLGNLGHQFGIPGLLAVIRDKTDEEELRSRAIVGLSRIPNKRAVDHLIDAMQDKKLPEDLRVEIKKRLSLLTNRKPKDTPRKKGSKLDRAADWKTWWKKNRKGAKLKRAASKTGAKP